MPFSITTRLLGFVSGGLGIALALALGFGWLQTDRLKAAKLTISSQTTNLQLLAQRVISDRGLIASRDQLIGKQNLAVLAIQKSAQADRTAYLARIAAADKVAKTYQNSASNILARQIETRDELERSRAALALIKEVLAEPEGTTNVHP